MKNIFALFLLIGSLTTPALSQEMNISGDLNNPLPVDPNVKVGTLKNGMTYYIRKNTKPEKRVEMRLVVNVGSVLEDEDQLGLAHFIEHMAFNGTKNFEKNEIVSFLQSIGVEFGADLNAYTSFDETVYILPLPTDDEEVLDKGLLILEDWAHNITFDEEEVDKERGVVIEEWRLGRGANQRMRDQYFPVLFKNSRYAVRLPIGKKDIIENASYDVIKRYYKDWYRPDLMSIIAVGDVDVDEMEAKIKSRFGKIKNPKNSRDRTFYSVPDHEQTFVAVTSDKEASFTQIQLLYKADILETTTLKEYRRDAVHQLYNGMLNERLSELTQSADPPFIFASTSFGGMVRTKSSYSSFAVVGEDGVEKGLLTLIEENERVRQYGFTKGELERYKKVVLNRYDQSYNERDKTESASYAREYIRAFLQNEPIPGIEYENESIKALVPGITVEEVNALANQFITKENRVVVITGPAKEGVVLPSEEEVLAMLDAAGELKIEPYAEENLGTSLMSTLPIAGTVAATKNIEDLGITEITFANGLKVVLKPTDFKNDEILMSGYSAGGSSLYSDEDSYSADNATDIINQSGVAEFSAVNLQKMLAGKTVAVAPYLSTLSEGFRGNAAPKDLETMLQLINLYFTNPRKDSVAFQSFIMRNKMLLQNLMSNPQFYYADKSSRIMTQNHPRGGGFPSIEDLDKINFDKSFEIFEERFANAGGFTFFFVGNFAIEEITPLLSQYLGSLPGSDEVETWKDLGVRPPKGVVKEVVNKGTDPKSMVTINFTGEKPYDKQTNYHLSSLGELLSIKLIEILREEKSGVYGVGASGSSSKYPYESYTMRIGFPCGPENVDDLISATMAEIEDIKTNGVSEEDLNKIKETQRRDREENLKENRYWLGQLGGYYRNNSDLGGFYEREKQVEALTADNLKAAANKYLNMKNYIQIVLMPEN
ncbi:MAG: insulinase family protein [Bacteroidetes bacterium]|nr:MAG: insulinase family protein [Bacteroidota bacterium]